MSLSHSRQQFLACETHGDPGIHYERKGGIFISTFICVSFVICAALVAVLVGIIVYYITFFKVSQKTEYWDDEAEPFAQSNTPSQDLRLPTSIVPSFYRLKLKVDLEKSTFSGDVYITIRANKKVKEVILHAKNLTINDNAALTEQIYEEVDTIQRVTRELNKTAQIENSTVIANSSDNVSTIIDNEVTSVPMVNYTQVTHSQVRNINIISISKRTGDRLVLTLAGTLTPDVDYTLQLGFKGEISDSLNGFYQKSLEIEEPDWQLTHFDRSVTMSTYLVAYVLSNFQSLETSYISKDNTTKIIKVWTQPALLSKANYALSITPKLLAFYEDIEPKWNMLESFSRDKMDLLKIDALKNTSPVSRQVVDASEISQKFDEISYSKALKSGDIKSPITKAQLLDDGFNLAKFGYLKYSAALGLTEFVIDGEDSVMVWDMVLGNMGFLRANLRATTGYPAFLDYIRLLISNQLQKLNYGLDEPKDDNESFLVDNLLSWECLAESPRCLRWARAEFDTWMRQADSNNNTIPSRHRNLVYNMAIKYGGREEFNFLWNVFQNSSDPNVKNLIISTLPNTREEHLTIFSITLTRNYFVRNFERVYAKFNDMDPFTFANILNMVFGDVSDQDELDRMKRFAIQHKEQLTPMSQTLQKIIDGANLKINWNRRYLNDVISALKNFVDEHANRNATITATETGLTENITISISNTTNSSR
ncbi:unnamed protein product [Leptidea sinapis]|uniref:Uncharacterized protein n=1 Tax=Leptidea sinapis TaxID=189913 RepID=A0A5E4QLQ0_9NEOP|nr:unnamed protein product [Leptidea sinapis]